MKRVRRGSSSCSARKPNRCEAALPPDVEVVIQDPPAGTGDAVAQATRALEGFQHVIVLSGDHPLLDGSFITALAERHVSSGAAATVTTRELDEPGQYGRVVRGADGSVERIVETKHPGDATPEEIAIKEINAGTYAFAVGPLFDALAGVRADNSQGEYYLGDVLPLLRAAGHEVVAHLTEDEAVGLGVNTRADLAVVRTAARARLLEQHMLAGVTIVDPASTVIDADVEIGEDTVIEPFSLLRGSTRVGADCTIGPSTTLTDCRWRTRARGALLSAGVRGRPAVPWGPSPTCGPGRGCTRGRRPAPSWRSRTPTSGPGVKVPHLSYIGDADLDEGTNIGAGTITANYDGAKKHRTTVGKDVRTGVTPRSSRR